MDWKESFAAGKELVLSTCSKEAIPNANIVISLGIVDGKLLVADCQMKITIKNLLDNPKISVIGGYFRLRGVVEVFKSGKYFDLCQQKSKGYTVKHAILIKIKEIFDLDQQKEVKLNK